MGEYLIALADWQLSCAPDRFTSKASATSARCGARSITPFIAQPTREAFQKTLVRDRCPMWTAPLLLERSSTFKVRYAGNSAFAASNSLNLTLLIDAEHHGITGSI